MRTALLAALVLLCLAAPAALFLFGSPPARDGAREGRLPGSETRAARQEAGPPGGEPGAELGGEVRGRGRQAAAAPEPETPGAALGLAGPGAAQTLRGSVRSLGGPALAGAELELAGRDGKPVARATTSAAGTFTLELPRPVLAGRLEVRAAGHVPFSLTGLRVAEGAQLSLGALHLDREALLQGRVLDTSGRPLADVRAILHVNARGSRLDLAAVTGPDGVFRFPGAPATGRHVLELVPPSGTPSRFPVSLPGPEGLEFRL